MMDEQRHRLTGPARATRWPGWPATVVFAVLSALACRDRPAMLRVMEARQRVGELTVGFTKASDATNRAVMAVTDDTSRAAAQEARRASDAVQRTLDTALPLLQGLGYQPETQHMERFRVRFTEYRALEARILDLAVENSNVKAQRLSFGPASDRADAVVDALGTAATGAPGDWRMRALVGDVTTAVRALQAWQAPHIAESEDASMTVIERRMATAEAAARQAFRRLTTVAPPASRRAVGEAATAFDAFITSHGEILALSRRNTNVRSLALALNEKGKLTLACDEILQTILEGLDTRTSYGTR